MNIKKIALCTCLIILYSNFLGYANKNVPLASQMVSKTSVNYKEYNIPKFSFYGSIEDASVIEYKNFKIVVPASAEINKQLITQEKIVEEFKKIPLTLTKNIKEIQLLDYRNSSDKYWEKTYNMKNLISFATGGNNKISFFANSNMGIDKVNMKVQSAIAHECGHILDETISSIYDRYSSKKEWADIMLEDLINKDVGEFGLYCSKYSKSSSSNIEDFAEAITQYVVNKDKFIKEYPNRSKKIEQLLNETN